MVVCTVKRFDILTFKCLELIAVLTEQTMNY